MAPRIRPFMTTLAAMALVHGSAAASPPYPAAIRGDLGLSYAPPCALCHKNGVTGVGTVNTPFGKSMRAHGLVLRDEDALAAALDALAQESVDSDQDGEGDIDELVAGTDPNIEGGEPLEAAEGPTYGCGLAAPGRTGRSTDFVTMLVVVAVLAARRRRAARGAFHCSP